MQSHVTQLAAQRRAIRRLLRERDPADAMAAYYAFHHPDDRTVLVLTPEGVEANPIGHADGYVALSRTGIDLFRPLVTMRLPTDREPDSAQKAADLLSRALAPGQPVILNVPARYRPLITALFDVETEEALRLLILPAERYEPSINVLVRLDNGPGGLPRYTVPSAQEGPEEIVASASLNWQSPDFAEIAVNTRPMSRRQGWGRVVVQALSGHILDSGRSPLYVVAEENEASAALAESVGFVDTGVRKVLLQATLKER